MAPEGDATDWERLRMLREEDIDKAIGQDRDAYALDDAELLGRVGASYRYVISQDGHGDWRWALLAADGELLAVAGQPYRSRLEALEAIGAMRDALLGGRSEAA